MAITWERIVRRENTTACGLIPAQVYQAAHKIYMLGGNYLYTFDWVAETITETLIGTYSSHGVSGYRPNSDLTLHNGSLFATKCLTFSTAGEVDRKILQVFRIDKDTGGLTLVTDSWDALGMDQIYGYWFCYQESVGYPDGWETELKGSSIKTAKLISQGGSLHIVLAYAYEPRNWDFSGAGTCPWPLDKIHEDLREHNNVLYSSYDSAHTWEAVISLEIGDHDIDFSAGVNAYGNSNESEAELHLLEGAGGWMTGHFYRYRYNGWELLSRTGSNLPRVMNGFDNVYWRVSSDGQKLEYADALLQSWTVYYDYGVSSQPHTSYYPHVENYQTEPIVATALPSDVRVYFGKTQDSDVGVIGGVTDGLTDYNAWELFSGDYVGVVYDDYEGGNTVLEFYKRVPVMGFGAIPTGLEIDALDEQLYITGRTAGGSSPFLQDISTTVLASGVSSPSVASGIIASGVAAFFGASGWMYPHLGLGSLYLYGFMGLDIKAALYSGIPICDTILAGLDRAAYIGALKSPYFMMGDDLHFTIVYSGAAPSGLFATAPSDGLSYNIVRSTPYPAVSMLRTMLAEPGIIGSGNTTFIGASGNYLCPMYATIDLAGWDTRCEGLPAVTITDISEG